MAGRKNGKSKHIEYSHDGFVHISDAAKVDDKSLNNLDYTSSRYKDSDIDIRVFCDGKPAVMVSDNSDVTLDKDTLKRYLFESFAELDENYEHFQYSDGIAGEFYSSHPAGGQIYEEIMAIQNSKQLIGGGLVTPTKDGLGLHFDTSDIYGEDIRHGQQGHQSIDLYSADAYDELVGRKDVYKDLKSLNSYAFFTHQMENTSDADFVDGRISMSDDGSYKRKGFVRPINAPLCVNPDDRQNYYLFDKGTDAQGVFDYMVHNSKDPAYILKHDMTPESFMKAHSFEDKNGHLCVYDNVDALLKSLQKQAHSNGLAGKDFILSKRDAVERKMHENDEALASLREQLNDIAVKIGKCENARKRYQKLIENANYAIGSAEKSASRSNAVDAAFGNITANDDAQKSGSHDVTD